MGGGGASGKVEYANPMRTFLEQGGRELLAYANLYPLDDWDDQEASSDPNDPISSPYSGYTLYTGSSRISALISQMDALLTDLGTFKSDMGTAELPSFANTITAAKAAADAMLPIADVNADVAAFSASMTAQINENAVPRYTGMMTGMGAVINSAFAIGLAKIQADATREVSKYSTDVHLRYQATKAEVSTRLVSQYKEWATSQASMYDMIMKQCLAARGLYGEALRLIIPFEKDANLDQLELDVADAKWQTGLIHDIGKYMATAAGASGIESKGITRMQGAISGGLAGASVGAQIGNMIYPGWGAAGGAATGGMIGNILGYQTGRG